MKHDERSVASARGSSRLRSKIYKNRGVTHVDEMLTDEALVSAVHQALVQRHPQSCRRGRPGFPAEVVLRLLILEAHPQLELCGIRARGPRQFGAPQFHSGSVPPRCPTRRPWAAGAWRSDRLSSIRSTIGSCRSPEPTMPLWQGRRMRIDGHRAGEQHPPSDHSSLAGRAGTGWCRQRAEDSQPADWRRRLLLRDRSRGVGLRATGDACAARGKAPPSQAKMKSPMEELLNATGRVRVRREALLKGDRHWREAQYGAGLCKRSWKATVSCLTRCSRGSSRLYTSDRGGIASSADSRSDVIVSLFEPLYEVIRKGKASKSNRVWQVGEAAGGRRSRSSLTMRRFLRNGPAIWTSLIPAIDVHQAKLGRAPRVVAADAGFYPPPKTKPRRKPRV